VLSSQSWPLQAQSQVLTAEQTATTSAVGIQLSRSQEGLMQSTVPRLLTFSQQIRPQQQQQHLAVVTQKPLLSSVNRHSGQHTALMLYSSIYAKRYRIAKCVAKLGFSIQSEI